MGDQKLVNAQQLGTLVRAQKPGDEIDLVIIREGKEMTVKAKLVEKEMPAGALLGDAVLGSGFPGGMLMPVETSPMWVDRFQPQDVVRSRGSMRYTDDEHQLEVQHVKDGLKLVVKDKAGKEIFNGPVTTDEDRKKVPEPLRTKLDKLDKSTRVTIERSAVIEPGGPGFSGAPAGIGFGPGAGAGGALDGEAIKKVIQEHLKGLKLEGAQQEQLKKQIDEMNKQIDALMKKAREQSFTEPAAPGIPGAPVHGIASFNTASTVASMNDGEHDITVKTNAKGKFLTVKDKDGKEIFNGPINNEEQLSKVPADVREKLETMDRATKGGIRLGVPGVPGGTPGRGTAPEIRERSDKEDDR
jgi:hypothetical protein